MDELFKMQFDTLSRIEKLTYIVEELDQCIDYTDDTDVPIMEVGVDEFINSFVGSKHGLRNWLKIRFDFLSGNHCGDCISYPMSCVACIYGDYLNHANRIVPYLIIGERHKDNFINYIKYNILCDTYSEYVYEFYDNGKDEACNIFCEQYMYYLNSTLKTCELDFSIENKKKNK